MRLTLIYSVMHGSMAVDGGRVSVAVLLRFAVTPAVLFLTLTPLFALRMVTPVVLLRITLLLPRLGSPPV